MLNAFPGIADDENTTKSFSFSFICLCVPFAILDNAANGSPCVPVHSKHTFSLGSVFDSSGVTNISLCFIYPSCIDISMLFSILLPNIAIFLSFFLHVSTICLSLYMFDANVAIIILP